ncbi:MAG: hypothetical protein COU25_02960 [Candidatus Levybacteria bacterium CG10_big_fil_rev_8_21_14_0_10_35_13]|nr:MAG: hypothetical protein COU25_02960 [Candidatus Levybacteria bacterium CG10_big_fil_rev_8_21_14_0_10_35_13]
MHSLNTETKIIIVGGIITILAVVGISLLLSSSSTSIPDDQIVAKNGLHWHPRLEIYINTEKQEIPANIGILPTKHEEIHTHDDASEGILHMEMNGLVTKDETRIARFFQIWGKKFNSGQIFEFKNSSEAAVKMLVNGKENKDFENYQMKDGDLIIIRYE